MDRRLFLKRLAIASVGIVAANELDLIERLSHKKNWAGHRFTKPPFDGRKFASYVVGFSITQEMIDDDAMYHSKDSLFNWSKKIEEKIGDIVLPDSSLYFPDMILPKKGELDSVRWINSPPFPSQK